MEKKLKIILCIVIIILIALVSFIGVYTKDVVFFKNLLPNFKLSPDFEEKRISSFVLEDSTIETIYDKDGNTVASIPEDANKDDYRTESKKTNPDENCTKENYQKVKEIFDGRLKSLDVENYTIRLDENTGKILVEIGENYRTDKLIQYLLCKGDFAMTDSKTKDVLLDKSNIKNVRVAYVASAQSEIQVCAEIEFDKEGAKKLADISREYKKVENENSDAENSDDQNKEDDNQKKVTLTIEGSEILSSYFSEELTNGKLPITFGSGKDAETLQEYVEQAQFYAMLLNNDEMPLTYAIEESTTVKGNLTGTDLYVILGAILVISAIIIIYMIVRYKLDGVIAVFSIIGGVSLLLLSIRYTNTEISLNSIIALIFVMIINVYLISKMLNRIKQDNSYENIVKATTRTYFENIEIIIVSLIVAVVFTFMQFSQAFSFGMVLFYGIISIAIANLLFLRTMLIAKYKD